MVFTKFASHIMYIWYKLPWILSQMSIENGIWYLKDSLLIDPLWPRLTSNDPTFTKQHIKAKCSNSLIWKITFKVSIPDHKFYQDDLLPLTLTWTKMSSCSFFSEFSKIGTWKNRHPLNIYSLNWRKITAKYEGHLLTKLIHKKYKKNQRGWPNLLSLKRT